MSFKWRLYYEDGSTFSDTDGQTWESPEWGIIGASQKKGNPALVGQNGDVLLYRADLGVWHLIGWSGVQDHLSHYAHLIECFRMTRWMPQDDEFFALWDRVREESSE